MKIVYKYVVILILAGCSNVERDLGTTFRYSEEFNTDAFIYIERIDSDLYGMNYRHHGDDRSIYGDNFRYIINQGITNLKKYDSLPVFNLNKSKLLDTVIYTSDFSYTNADIEKYLTMIQINEPYLPFTIRFYKDLDFNIATKKYTVSVYVFNENLKYSEDSKRKDWIIWGSFAFYIQDYGFLGFTGSPSRNGEMFYSVDTVFNSPVPLEHLEILNEKINEEFLNQPD
jgi:hypothetical protein